MRERNRISRLFYFEGVASGIFTTSIAVSTIELVRFSVGQFKFSESPWVLILPIVASTYVSVRAITEQSRLQVDNDNEKFDREKLLSQAELPMALSSLVEQCGTMMKYHFTRSARQVDWSNFDKLFDGLKPAIRNSNRSTSDRLLKIIRTYQVLRARMRNFKESKRDLAQTEVQSWIYHDVWSSAIDWATLHAMIEQAFSYARGIDDDVPSEEVTGRVYSAFFINDIMIENYPLLQELLKRGLEYGFEMNFSEQ